MDDPKTYLGGNILPYFFSITEYELQDNNELHVSELEIAYENNIPFVYK